MDLGQPNHDAVRTQQKGLLPTSQRGMPACVLDTRAGQGTPAWYRDPLEVLWANFSRSDGAIV